MVGAGSEGARRRLRRFGSGAESRVHKKRNILDHLLSNRELYVARMLAEAWTSDSAALARRQLKTLRQWLERNGEHGAAASLREGMEETLTVLKLELPTALCGFLVTTKCDRESDRL